MAYLMSRRIDLPHPKNLLTPFIWIFLIDTQCIYPDSRLASSTKFAQGRGKIFDD